MRRAAACTACIAAGAACLLAGEYFFHIALDASTDKSALLKPAPGAKKPEKRLGAKRNAGEAVRRLKEQYEDREILSFDRLRLHGYLCLQREPSKKWVILVHGYSGLWFGREALAFYQAGFNLLLPDARGHGKSQGTYVGMGWHDRLDIKKWICWLIKQYPESEIVLYGVSMGAASVMMAAGEELPPNVKAAVEDCGYTSAWSVLSYQVPIPSAGFPVFILRGFGCPHKGRVRHKGCRCIKMRGQDQAACFLYPRHGGPVCAF
jgi:pimeloyl-ACP methyl ester carboxylesterase